MEDFDIMDFNADDAKKISEPRKSNELRGILLKIKNIAKSNSIKSNVLHLYEPFEFNETIEKLREKGFEVVIHNSFSIELDNLNYSIYW